MFNNSFIAKYNNPKLFSLLVLTSYLIFCFITYFRVYNITRGGDDFYYINYYISDPFIYDISFFRPLFKPFLISLIRSENLFFASTLKIVLHSINAFMVFIIIRRLSKTNTNLNNNQYIPYICGLIFLMYPNQNEIIFSYTALGVSLSTFISFLSIILFILYTEIKSVFYLVSSAFAYFISLLTYESGIFLPVFFSFYILYKANFKIDKTIIRSILKSIVPFFSFLLIFFIMRYMAIGTFIGAYGDHIHTNYNIGLLFRNIFLCTARTILPPINPPMIFISIALIIFLFLLFVLIKNYKKLIKLKFSLLFCLSSFYILLLPVLNLSMNFHTTEGNRRLYLPSFLIILFFITIINELVQ